MKNKLLLLSLLILVSAGGVFAQNNARMLSTPNAQTGTTYTFTAADTTRVVTFSNASPVAVTLPNGATAGFGGGTILSVVNLGAGQVTITCSSCTINGAATLVLSQNSGADIYGGAGSPSVNYIALPSPTGTSFAGVGANNTFTGNNTHSGTETFANVNGVIYVGGSVPQVGGSADMGAQINAAYALLPAPGSSCYIGTIYVAPSTNGSAYNFSTPIVLNTPGKLAKLAGLGGTVTLNYTPTTATTAVTLDYLNQTNCPNTHWNGHGIENIRLINNGDGAPNGGPGGGSSATGVLLGTTNGAEGATFKDFSVSSFATGVSNPGSGVSSFGTLCINCVLARNNTGWTTTTTVENLTFIGGRIIVNGTGISYGNGDTFAYGVSFDANTVLAVNGTGNFHGNSNHWENFNASNCNFIQSTAGSVSLNGDAISDDTAVGNCNWFINLNGGTGAFSGVTLTSGGQTATQVVQVNQPSTASGYFINNSVATLTTLFGGSAFPQGVTDLSSGKASDPIHASLFGQGIKLPQTANAINSPSRSVTFANLDAGGVERDSTLGVGVNTANRTYTLPDITGTITENTQNAVLRQQQIVSDQGTACTNGELALSAGWQSTGSATVTGVKGNGQTCEWTITTGTTTAANPTVTDTLTNVLPNATTVCEMIITGGNRTPAAGDGFDQTTLSATAPVFTFQGTPTSGGKTYQVLRRCGP